MNAKEIQIPVPWGIISAKTWGSPTDPIALLFHGLLDNANSFDYLVCKLPYAHYFVSVDLPGHGKSDNLPSVGLPLQGMDYVYVIKLLVDHFQREKYIIIGHSFGASLGMQYSIVYPEKIDKLFLIDTLWFEIVPPNQFGQWTRNKFDEFTKISYQMQRSTSALFTYDECLELMTSWRYNNYKLKPNAAETLLKRSIKLAENGKYKFTRDPKLKNYMGYPLNETYACDMLTSHNINFKVVVMITKDYEAYYNHVSPKLVETYKKIGDWVSVEGDHQVHLNDPDIIANVINRYFDEAVPI